MSTENKQKLKEYQKNIKIIKKCMTISITNFSFISSFFLNFYALS